jgi:DNA-directed RNA polymerase specialized sigma24 family protein
MRRTFARRGLGYVMELAELSTELTVSRLNRSRGETHGELTVTCALPGTRSSDGHLHQATFNLSGSEARNRLAKAIAGRANLGELIDWLDVLEDFCRRVLAAERQGDPTIRVGGLPVQLDEQFRLDPIVPLEGATILFGAGGTGKSTLAAAIALSVETGVAIVGGFIPRKAPILYLDWEAGQNSINRRIRGVAMGANLPFLGTIGYKDCRRRGPLHSFAEDVAAEVDREGYGLVVVDSVGMAAGTSSDAGDANESAIRLFSAFGFVGTTILAIDHVKKEDKEDERKQATPYGSVFKENLARATWELRSTRNDRGTFVGLYNAKVNDFDKHQPISLQVHHLDDGSIAYDRVDRLPVELTRNLSQREQIVASLREYGHMTTEEISEITGLADNKVRAVMSRYGHAFNRLASGKWEVLPNAG